MCNNVMCGPVCGVGVGVGVDVGWGLQHRPCYVLSCLPVCSVKI